MAKLNRERRLRERRAEKQIKKDQRKREAAADHARQEADVPLADEELGTSTPS